MRWEIERKAHSDIIINLLLLHQTFLYSLFHDILTHLLRLYDTMTPKTFNEPIFKILNAFQTLKLIITTLTMLTATELALHHMAC